MIECRPRDLQCECMWCKNTITFRAVKDGDRCRCDCGMKYEIRIEGSKPTIQERSY